MFMAERRVPEIQDKLHRRATGMACIRRLRVSVSLTAEG